MGHHQSYLAPIWIQYYILWSLYGLSGTHGVCLYAKNTRALRNSRIQPPSSDHSRGAHECCTVRNTRSGCGITEVTRPSALHSPARPSAEPFGLQGYFSVGRPRLSTYCRVTSCRSMRLSALPPGSNSARPSPCATTMGSTEPCMPANNTDCDAGTRTSVKRASYCSDRLRTNRGQASAPGISSLSADSI